MKYFFGVLFCLVSWFSFSQNAVVIKTDTIYCEIVSIEPRGVVFEYDGQTRVASLDIVKAVLLYGKWMHNHALRLEAATKVEDPAPEPIVRVKYADGAPAKYIHASGKAIMASGIAVVVTAVAVYIMIRQDIKHPGLVGAVGYTFSIGALIYGGHQLQQAAAAINSF